MSQDLFYRLMEMAYPLWERMGPDVMPRLVLCCKGTRDEFFDQLGGGNSTPDGLLGVGAGEVESDIGTFRVEVDQRIPYGRLLLVHDARQLG